MIFAELPISHPLAQERWINAFPVIHADRVMPKDEQLGIAAYLNSRPKGTRGLTPFYCPRRCLDTTVEQTTATQRSVADALIRCAESSGYSGILHVGNDLGWLEMSYHHIRENLRPGVVIDGPCWFDGGEMFPDPESALWAEAWAQFVTATGIADKHEQNRIAHRLMLNSCRHILTTLGIAPSLAVVATCAKIDTGYAHNEVVHGGFDNCPRSHFWATHPLPRTTERLRENLAKRPKTHHAYVTLSPDIGPELEPRMAIIKARKNTHVLMYAGMRNEPPEPPRSLIPDLEALAPMLKKYTGGN